MKARSGIGLLLLAAAVAAPLYSQEFKATQIRFFPFVNQAVDVELSRFGSYTAVADWTDGNTVSVLDRNWELLWRHRQPYYWGGTLKHAPVLQFAPDESFLLFPGYRTDNDIGVVDPRTGEALSVLTAHSGTVSALSLSPDGSLLLSYAGGELFLSKRDGSAFRVADRLAGDVAAVTGMAFSSRGEMAVVAATSDRRRTVTIYSVAGGKLVPIRVYSRDENNLSKEFTGLSVSPDGRWLAAGYSDSLFAWRMPERATGEATSESGARPAAFEPAQTIDGIELGSVISTRFSPDSRLLLCGFYKDVRSYRESSGRWQTDATFSPHQGNIRDLAFSLDGSRLLLAGRSESNGLGLWAATGAGASGVGRIQTLLEGRISEGQKRFLDEAVADRLLSSLAPDLLAPRDMFETEAEFDARRANAARQTASKLQELTEQVYNVSREQAAGALYSVVIPLQTQGSYDIDRKRYSFTFMEENATVSLERDQARDLYRNWREARVVATRVQTPEGPSYGDFRLRLPAGGRLGKDGSPGAPGAEVPVGISENPFTGEKLDRYGVRVPSVAVGPDLLLRNLTIDGIFPSLLRFYAEHPLGRFDLQNTGSSTLSDLSVRFSVPGLTQSAVELGLPSALGVGQSVSAEIRALFSSSILSQPEGTTQPAELDVRYSAAGKSYRETVSRPVAVLNRNAIRWNDDRKVAAFVFVNDPSLLRYSTQVSGMLDDITTNVLTRNLLTAVRMFEAVSASGVSYVVDPKSPYDTVSRDAEAVDFVRFPVETLDQKGGDCDDLSVLLNSLLESVGVSTAFITTPGHILTAFDLGMKPEAAARIFPKQDDLIVKEGSVWLPVETTMVGEGFTKAWQQGAVEWREAEASGVGSFFTTRSAWAVYPPAGFTVAQGAAVPQRDRVVSLFNEELDAYRKVNLGPRESELLARLESSPTAGNENQLGILYAQYGLLTRALDRFKRALAKEEYLPAMINAANVLSLRKQYDEARTYLMRAEKIDPDNAHILLNLAYAYFQSGSESEARSTFERASRVDPALAARYPLFSLRGSGEAVAQNGGTAEARAARDSRAAQLFGGEWSVGK